jgi:hypothetical protein
LPFIIPLNFATTQPYKWVSIQNISYFTFNNNLTNNNKLVPFLLTLKPAPTFTISPFWNGSTPFKTLNNYNITYLHNFLSNIHNFTSNYSPILTLPRLTESIQTKSTYITLLHIIFQHIIHYTFQL